MTDRRRERFRDNAREQICAVARKQMAENGTAAVSLRAIARELELTAPALYRYFASRDELITALILDAFNSLADALVAANTAAPGGSWAQMTAVLIAYRAWALAHPSDFQLIYGNPIPGYEAPAEQTVPAAQRGFDIIVGLLSEALKTGHLTLPAERLQLPPTIAGHLAGMVEHEGYNVSPEILYLAVLGWTRIHGILMLELFEHIQPVIGDMDSFYRFEMAHLLQDIGLKPDS